jgi:hypothetical protein
MAFRCLSSSRTWARSTAEFENASIDAQFVVLDNGPLDIDSDTNREMTRKCVCWS